MKNFYTLKHLFFSFFIFLFFYSSLLAQDVGEECDNGKCDDNLYCVEVNINSRKMELCSECTQSELDSYTRTKKDKCDWMSEGRYLETNPLYTRAISDEDDDQDRVSIEIYDELMENLKKCKKAREDRDNECWDGGDTGHIRQITDIQTAISKTTKKKEDDIRYKRVFYCSKSTYESAMRNYKYNCGNLNLSNIERELEDMEDDIDDGNKIDCDDLEDYIDDCEECYKKAYDLVRYAFDSSSSKTPDNIQETMDEAEALQELAEELLKKAESDDLCD